MGFYPAGMAPCSGLWESPVMLRRVLPGISAGAGALLVLWDVRSQCRSMCSLSSVPPWHSQGTEQHPCLKGGGCHMYGVSVGILLPVWVSPCLRGLKAASWDGGAPRKLISIGICWGYGNQLLATALDHNLQGWVLPELWGLTRLGSRG